ncbi:hypothetical protein SAMN04489724_0230 [Algoriphagus locisalis]|uniref:Uncharacterized protein n=1 Tax=Algoriphagus locisalis TaxID=305507 RepID=A0A1I7E821_9BACT|nr:hypothetical protein [Algoriphagus locisalis]SFU20080.1 hypothetical protein SAMN04489724_0230 [Algoriphagus locisalis]
MNTSSKTHFIWILIVLLSSVQLLHAQSSTTSTSRTTNSSNFVYKDDNQKLKIESNGKIEISSDEKSISFISPGGSLKIEKTIFGNSRSITIKNDGAGLEHDYKEGGRKKPFEPDGKAWLAEMLPEMMNTTTLGAGKRVDRLFANGGAKAVLAKVDQMKSDYVKSTYLGLLMKKNLSPAETSACIDMTLAQIDSDHYQLEVYKSVNPSYFKDFNQLNKVVAALDSDHFKTELLKPIFKTNVTEGKGQESINLIKMLDSDHFKTEIAKSISFSSLSDQELKFMVNELVPTIDSDHFKNDLLKTAADKGNMNEARALIILEGVKSIDSDHFKADLLTHICRKQGTEKVKAKIRETAKSTIDSSHFLGEVAKCAS